MEVDISGVRQGMDVRSSEGEKIGTVAAVEETDIGGSGLDTGDAGGLDAGSTPNVYVVVQHSGLFGAGKETLYVPANQVASVDPDQGVTLACTRDACEAEFAVKPPGLP